MASTEKKMVFSDPVKKGVLFLDLDGTIIETVSGRTFPTFVGDMKFKENFLPALKNFVENNDLKIISIVSNQGGIESGHVLEYRFGHKLNFIMCCLADFLQKKGLAVVGTYCNKNEKTDPNRKPNTGMLSMTLDTYNIADTEENKRVMLMVGDASGLEGQFSDSDKQTAINFGIDYMDISEFIAANLPAELSSEKK
jgi:DNA 3'-phosphatase